jgi:PAS domain S-box-containing protein
MPSALDFQAIFESSPNPYMLLDRELRFVAANPAYLRATASDLGDLLGRHVLDVFPHDPSDPANQSATVLRASLERVLATGEQDVLAIIRYRVPQIVAGVRLVNERFWSATHTPIRGDGGRVEYILQHTVDVTELQRLRQNGAGPSAVPGDADHADRVGAGVMQRAQALQEANTSLDLERRDLRRLFEQAPGFMCFLRGKDLVFEIANSAYYKLVGHREILGKSVREALPELADQGYFDLLDRVFSTGEPFVGRGMRVLVQQTPGEAATEVFLDFSYQPIFEPDGRTAGVLVQGYDITLQTRQQAEHALLLERERAAREAAEAAERRQRFLAEAIPQQVWTATPGGELDFVNARVLEYFGASEEEMLGGGWQAAVHPDDLRTCVERWRQSLRTGEEYEVEFRLRRADGSYRWHLGRALAFCGDDGRVSKWFGTNTDMDELRRARDELAGRAGFDRQLVGIVSHDLRNPLNAIGMATGLLLKMGRLDEQHVRIVRRIMSSSERAVRLIRDFLDFTQARVSGQIPVSRTDADIEQIARQVFDEVHLTYPDRRATFEHTGEASGWWDPDRIAQVIGNLIGNAFQHGASNGVVRVSIRGSATDVVIEVGNEGSPIPPGDLARMFEPFERGATSDARSARSVGLGLYISKQIVAAHGGTIEVRSDADEGTCFTVRLPRGLAGEHGVAGAGAGSREIRTLNQ